MNYKQNGLAAPVILVAQADGLISTSDLEQDIAVHFPVWLGAKSGDSNQLLINSTLEGMPVVIPDPFPGEGAQLTLTIPVNTCLKEDGLYAIQYRATTFPGDTPADSPITMIRVDRTAPGASLLAPVIFSDINFGPTLTGKVPGYAGMAVGDTLQTLCNEALGPICVVQPDHLTVLPIEVVFDRDFLESLGSETISVSYQVTDRAGNSSILAPGVELTLQG